MWVRAHSTRQTTNLRRFEILESLFHPLILKIEDNLFSLDSALTYRNSNITSFKSNHS